MTPLRHLFSSLLLTALLVSTTGITPTQARPKKAQHERFSVRAGLVLGFGGSVSLHNDFFGGSVSADLKTTAGFRLQADYPLHRYVTVGFLNAYRWVGFSGSNDRGAVISLNVVPRGRYAFLNERLETYLSLPIGLDILDPPGDFGPAKAGTSFSFGFFPGAQYFFTKNWGAYLELGFRTMNLHLNGYQASFSTTGVQFHTSIGVNYAF